MKTSFLISVAALAQQTVSKINQPKDVLNSIDETITTRRLNEFFQLKLFWENGVEWQQRSTEKKWCAECEHIIPSLSYENSNCKSGDNVVIKECNDGKKDQRWIFEEDKIKSKVTGLCFTARDGLDGYIYLRDCEKSIDKYQEFDLSSSNIFDFDKFQIRTRDDDDLCLTQDHHPKEGEKLKFVNCIRAEKNDPGVYDDTSHWVIGKFDGYRA